MLAYAMKLDISFMWHWSGYACHWNHFLYIYFFCNYFCVSFFAWL